MQSRNCTKKKLRFLFVCLFVFSPFAPAMDVFYVLAETFMLVFSRYRSSRLVQNWFDGSLYLLYSPPPPLPRALVLVSETFLCQWPWLNVKIIAASKVLKGNLHFLERFWSENDRTSCVCQTRRNDLLCVQALFLGGEGSYATGVDSYAVCLPHRLVLAETAASTTGLLWWTQRWVAHAYTH